MSAAATVYLVTNRLDGKTYIGVTRFNLTKRWSEHLWKSTTRARTYLHRAIAKHGPQNFTIEPIASCLSPSSPSEVERAIIKQRAPIYNQTNGGEITRGKSVSREVAERRAAKNRGRKRTPEQIAANSAQAKARWENGSPEFRATALAAAARGRANIDQEKRKRAAGKSARERQWSVESRAKLSASCMGRRYSREIIDRMIASKTKPVICSNLGKQFASVDDASAALSVSTSSIYKICAGARKTVKGMAFSYVE